MPGHRFVRLQWPRCSLWHHPLSAPRGHNSRQQQQQHNSTTALSWARQPGTSTSHLLQCRGVMSLGLGPGARHRGWCWWGLSASSLLSASPAVIHSFIQASLYVSLLWHDSSLNQVTSIAGQWSEEGSLCQTGLCQSDVIARTGTHNT